LWAILLIPAWLCMQQETEIRTLTWIVTVILLLLLFCWLGMLVWNKKYRLLLKKTIAPVSRLLRGGWDRWDVIVAAAFLLVLSVWIFCPMPFSETYDTPERVVSYLQEGRFFAGNILTGEPVQTDVSWLDSAQALPALYACVCSLFRIPVMSLLYIVLPVPYLLLIFAVQKELAACFFPKQKWLQALFILSFALLTVFGGRAYMNTSYGILYFWYEGTVLFSNVVLPLCFLFFLQKKPPIFWILLILDAILLAGFAKGIAVLAAAVCCLVCAHILERVTEGLRGGRCRLWK
jgi:hypothetical protein